MKRQRADGSWTNTSPDWDARWHWTAGTRVQVGDAAGAVTRVNRVTVDVRLDDGRELPKVPMPRLVRL